MSDLRGTAQQESVPRFSDGRVRDVRVTRDGSLIQLPWYQACIMEGLGFGVGFGDAANSATTPGTFLAGGIQLVGADLLHTLPSNGSVGVIPLYWKPVTEAIGTIAATEALLVYGSGGVIGTNSITATPVNLKPDASNASVSTIAGLSDADGTAVAVTSYIYREGGTHLTGVAGTGQTFMPGWSIAKTGFAPVVTGASRQIAGFVSAQAPTGFITYHWLELPAEYL